jgi:hypothetical protein
MSKKSNWLYHFSVPRMVEEEIEIDPIQDKDGNEIKQFKKIKKEKPVTCGIKKPNRGLYEEGELYYSVELSRFIQAGMLTKTLLAKRFANDGGAISEREQNHYSELYASLHTKEQEVQRIQLDTDNAKKRAKKLQKLLLEITSIRQQLVEFESTQSALFDQTAEHKARNKAILWWVLNLSYIKDTEDENEKEVFRELFTGSTVEEKLKTYDSIEEDESENDQAYLQLALKKFAYFVSFWYSGQAVDKEGFDAAEKLLDEVDIFQVAEDQQQEKQDNFKEVLKKEEEHQDALVEVFQEINEKTDEELNSIVTSTEEENIENLKNKSLEAEAAQDARDSELKNEPAANEESKDAE